MPELGSLVSKVRSKNAGPFWLTIDVFCDDPATYARVRDGLKDATVARLFGVEQQLLKRFDIPALNVVKFSVPRPVVQGTRADRDMHGAGWACLLEELQID
ncbi:DUF4387 family protein [Shinella sp. 838]|jgi:hypothetical protein|uniref:DUF4387 family protein n=1 Tax=unclassified Shinella TaxID=2643062 RepID=UPI0003C54472|nr:MULTISPECIES: DUF4387 family protein [unclassified Shinella]EYR83963.1 hypothetical protein SHLA_16c000210 [Shinella sp. DD12]MCA0344497.1 DUF4387 domain-containing protein [Pseudomonadota bacterium]MDG4673201.1 DUF4387 family protein [Shinella sp. 838]TAA60091.1 DUF4387 family protein [Shinella sp. JR1-6]